jgi:catechol 2,3-dioxygenase-like lactoylglutathione lyase family enzyme
MKIERIDHLNITVADIDRSVEFYQRVLGMKTESMGEDAALFSVGRIHLDAPARRGDERRKTDAGTYLLYHRGTDRQVRPSRKLRRAGGQDRAPGVGTIQSVYIMI